MKQKYASIKQAAESGGQRFMQKRAGWLAIQAAMTVPALLAISFAMLAPPASAAQPAAAGGEQYARGRILVMPRAGLSANEFAKVLAPHGGRGRKVGQSDLHIVDLPGNASEKAVIERLLKNPHIKFAELDRAIKVNFDANDPLLGSEWHLGKVNASAAWDLGQGSGVTVAILDTGVESTHPDLAAQMVAGYNFVDGNNNTADVHGHGTAVAGVAAASSNNGIGVAGVAGKAKIMPIRVADATGYAYYSTISQGITYAADHGVRVANASFGGAAGSSSIQSAAQYMKNKGGLVFVAAGNNGIDENFTPTTTLIAVSATDEWDNRTSWSSYGNFVSLAAPGIVYTTRPGGSYGQAMGTSFSSPLAAGVAALVMSANPSLGSAQVEKLLFSTAVDLGSAGRDNIYGYGRVDAGAAVRSAASTVITVDNQAPSVAIANLAGSSTVTGLVPVNVSASDNVGVARVELKVNNVTVAVDDAAPFAFSWDSTGVANGMASVVAYAYDAAGNVAASSPVSVNVANTVAAVQNDTAAPQLRIANPTSGRVNGNVTVSTSADDNSGAANVRQSLFIDGQEVARGTGSSLAYNWNSKKASKGTHTIKATATDAAGNTTTTSVSVSN